ncbi:MAG TPA: serine hydrolase [Gemmatimonadaceae bacterium]|nr:serine hydrolase [Gemmatimonadaceae bacterium]
MISTLVLAVAMLQAPSFAQTSALNQLAQDSLLAQIQKRIAETAGATVAVSYIDLQTGDSIALNPDTMFHAASTMKIPVMIEVLRRAQSGAFSIDQPLLLVNQFHSIVDGSAYSLDKAEDGDTALYSRLGERVPIRDLMRRMITLSSNLATNQLIALVDAKRVTEMARSLGATRMQVLRGVEDQKAFDRGMINTTSSADLATLLMAIETGRALSPASSAVMREILLAQEFKTKIPAGLPPGTRVAHKTGEITAVSHDAAVVYPEGRKPYVLVVLTRGVRESKDSSQLIADVSRIVYAHATRSAR